MFILQYLLGLLILPLGSWAIGHFVIRGFGIRTNPVDSYGTLFLKMTLGTFLGVALFAAIVMHGSTILLGFWLIALLVGITYKKQKKQLEVVLPDNQKINWVLVGAAYLFIAIVFGLFSFNLSDFPYNTTIPDIGIYATIGQSMMEGAGENPFLAYNFLTPDQYGNSTYHYMEPWFSAMMSSLTGLPGFTVLQSLHMVWFALLTLLGLLAFGSWRGIRVHALFVASITLFVLFRYFYKEFMPGSLAQGGKLFATFMEFSYLESVAYLPVIFLSAVLLWQRGYFLAGLVLLSVIVYLIAGAFSWLIVSMLLLLYWKWRKTINWKQLVWVGVCYGLAMGFYLGFYKLTGIQNDQTKMYGFGFSKIISGISEIKLGTAINIVGLSSIQLVVLLLPIVAVILLISSRLKEDFLSLIKKPWFLYGVSLPIVAIVLWAAFSSLIPIDAIKLFGYSLPVLATLLILIAVYFWPADKPKRILPLLVLLLIGFGFTSYRMHQVSEKPLRYSPKFTYTVGEYQHTSPVGAYIPDTTNFTSLSGFAKNYRTFHIHPLTAFDNYLGVISLLDDEVAWNENSRDDIYVRSGLFYYNYCQQPEQITIPKEERRLNFIRKYKLDWLVVAKEAKLPANIKPLVKKQFIDSYTGTRIYFLNLK